MASRIHNKETTGKLCFLFFLFPNTKKDQRMLSREKEIEYIKTWDLVVFSLLFLVVGVVWQPVRKWKAYLCWAGIARRPADRKCVSNKTPWARSMSVSCRLFPWPTSQMDRWSSFWPSFALWCLFGWFRPEGLERRPVPLTHNFLWRMLQFVSGNKLATSTF